MHYYVSGFINTSLGFGEPIALKNTILLIERNHIILERNFFIGIRDSN